MTPESFLDSIYTLVATSRVADATSLVFDHIDRLLCDGNFVEVDAILAGVDAGRLDNSLCSALMAVTKVAEPMLLKWEDALARLRRRFVEIRGEEAAKKVMDRFRR